MLNGKRTFGNSKLKVVYAVREYKSIVLTYKYAVVNKKVKTNRSIREFNCGSKETTIDLQLRLINYCGRPYDCSQEGTLNVSVNSKYSVSTVDDTVYCCSRETFDKMIEHTKSNLLDSLALCNLIVSPNQSLKTVGIFSNAKTGDKFETVDHRVAYYLYKYYANNNPKLEFHVLYVDGSNTTGSFYRPNGESNSRGMSAPNIIKKL